MRIDRITRRRAAACVLLPISCALAGLAIPSADSARPHRGPPPKQFGFNTFVTPGSVGLARLVGGSVVRMIVPWSSVERSRGVWDWSESDREYSEVVSAGLRPVVTVFAAPCWARPSMVCDEGAYTGPPDRLFDSDWGVFVGAVAARYPLAVGVEVWNEPNMSMFWWPGPDPVRFVQVLGVAFRAVKAVDPSMVVVSGGVAGSPVSGVVALGEGDAPFVRGVLAAGGGRVLDAIGVHPYPVLFGSGGSEVWDPVATGQSLGRVRAVRDAFGLGGVPLWVTEVGESTSTQSGFPPAVSAAQQASDLGSIVRELLAASDVPVVIIQSLEDQSVGTDDAYNGVNAGFGVLTAAGAPKPAGCTISALIGGSLSC